jgi:FAD/FMN-containing dehydrogenase
MIARPTSAADVVTALRLGRDEDLPIAVRSSGHSIPGHSTCDDGIVIDLGRLRGVTVDPTRRIAYVNGGALLGELDDAAQAQVTCNSGTVSHTGVAGLTLGGAWDASSARWTDHRRAAGLEGDGRRATDPRKPRRHPELSGACVEPGPTSAS